MARDEEASLPLPLIKECTPEDFTMISEPCGAQREYSTGRNYFENREVLT